MLFLVEILDFKKGNWTEVKPTKYIMNRYMEFTANSQSLTETMYNCMCFISNDCRNSFKEHSPIRRVRLFKNMEKSYDLLYSFDLRGFYDRLGEVIVPLGAENGDYEVVFQRYKSDYDSKKCKNMFFAFKILLRKAVSVLVPIYLKHNGKIIYYIRKRKLYNAKNKLILRLC